MAIALAVFFATAATSASAATFCVHSPPECAGTVAANLQAALNATAANGAGKDEIRLGVGLFQDGPAVDAVGNPVELIGVASNQTAIASTQSNSGLVILEINEPTTKVRDLRVHYAGASPQATGLSLAGDAEDVLVTNQAGAGAFDGVRMTADGASFVDSASVIGYPENKQNRAVFVLTGVSATIKESFLESAVGVADFGESTIIRTRIHAAVGVSAGGAGAKTKVEDTEIRVPGPTKSLFGVGGLVASGSGSTKLEADRVTAIGSGTGFGAWVQPNGGAGNSATMALRGSVVDGFGSEIFMFESAGANATLSTAYSAYDSTHLSINAGTTFVPGAGIVDLAGVDPAFVDPGGGDLSPRYDSPLIDAGDGTYAPLNGGLDLLGLTRVIDGDGGGAIVDIGAHEYQRRAPIALATGPSSGVTGQLLSFDGSQSNDPDEEATTLSWSFDDGTSAVGPAVEKSFSTPGSHTVTLTAADPTGLTDTAVVTVVISSAGGGQGQDQGALVLTGLKLVPSRFRVSSHHQALGRRARTSKKTGRGTRIQFTLSRAAPITFVVARARPKRRWRKVGSFTLAALSGANSVAWTGRIGKRALKPGRYRLTAQTGAGAPPAAPRARFRIVAP